MTSTRVVLLGSQRARPTLGDVVRDLGLRGPFATITAGWQEWEAEDGALSDRLGGAVRPLALYARAERVAASDPELAVAHGTMQAELRALQALYARQLGHAADAWMELLGADAPPAVLGPERDAALEAIRRLDAHHLARIEEMRADFEARTGLPERPSVARERRDIERALDGIEAVVIEGGHAAVIHNRMSLFGIAPLLGGRTVIGCSAGAMVLGTRVVLYDDSPALGRGHAEVGLPGLGLVPGVVALPNATARLRLGDAERMRRLALRIAPDRCALLDPGDRLDWDGSALVAHGGRSIDEHGALVAWDSAA